MAGWLREAGCTVVDADALVAELYAPGGEGSAAVARLFGEEVLTPKGGVDHPALAAVVFRDGEARQALEAAVHPLVKRRFFELAGGVEGIAVLEATLLVEAGYGPSFDRVVSVEAPAEIRLARAVARGLSEEAARGRLAAQGDGARRREGADEILDSSGNLEELRSRTDELLERVRSELEERAPTGRRGRRGPSAAAP